MSIVRIRKPDGRVDEFDLSEPRELADGKVRVSLDLRGDQVVTHELDIDRALIERRPHFDMRREVRAWIDGLIAKDAEVLDYGTVA